MVCRRCGIPAWWANIDEQCPAIAQETVRFFSNTGKDLLKHVWGVGIKR